jgi:hypothetical protein
VAVSLPVIFPQLIVPVVIFVVEANVACFVFKLVSILDIFVATLVLLVPSMICTIVQFSVQDCALVEIRRFHSAYLNRVVHLRGGFMLNPTRSKK